MKLSPDVSGERWGAKHSTMLSFCKKIGKNIFACICLGYFWKNGSETKSGCPWKKELNGGGRVGENF